MKQQWDADIEINPTQAQALIEHQFPSLAPVRLESFGNGWDNAAFSVNGRRGTRSAAPMCSNARPSSRQD